MLAGAQEDRWRRGMFQRKPIADSCIRASKVSGLEGLQKPNKRIRTNCEGIELLQHQPLVFGPRNSEPILSEEARNSLPKLLQRRQSVYRSPQSRQCPGNAWP